MLPPPVFQTNPQRHALHEGTWSDDRDGKRAGVGYGPLHPQYDTVYDAEENFELLFEYKLDPSIRQKPPGKNPEKPKIDMPNRVKGAELFDPVEYMKRDMIEGIFGAEEAKNHQLH